ncbi:hypothetical protein F66182_817 [Fusarium sp. NRRL 66182]|nr:hypothetical protein F66182_817 [Fusarium sp. NRRL 66182]
MPGNSTHKRKRQVSEGVLRGLEYYQDRELSPESSKLRDTLYEMANSGNADDGHLGKLYSFWLSKQIKCASLRDEVARLTTDNEKIRDEHEQARREIEDVEALLELGDWAAVCLGRIKSKEEAARKDERDALTTDYQKQNVVRKEEAEMIAKAQAFANNEKYEGPGPWGPVNPELEAKADTNWNAMDGRNFHSVNEKIKGETKAINDWRKSGEEDSDLPPTPFLDRIQRMCDKAGVSRADCLRWVEAYSERKAAHRPLPIILDFIKEIEQNGELVKVEVDKQNPQDSIDWARFKAAVENRKEQVEERYAQGKIDESMRDRCIELMNEYWRPLSEHDDEDGNPIPSQYAKLLATNSLDKAAKSPRPTAYRATKKPKFDDILMPESD